MYTLLLFASLLLMPVELRGETTISYSHQGPDQLKMLAYKLPKDISLYSFLVCSTEGVDLQGGHILRGAQARFSLPEASMAEAIISNQRRHTFMYYIYQGIKYAALIASPILPAITKLPAAAKVVSPGVTVFLTIIDQKLSQYNTPATAGLNFINSSTPIKIAPHACTDGLFLGSWQKGQLEKWTDTYAPETK